MKRLMNLLARYFEQVPDHVRKWKIGVWLFFIAFTVFMAMGFGRVKFDASIEGWFEAEDPIIVAFDWFHHEFGSDDHLYIAYKPKDGDVFSEKSLKTLHALQEEIETRVTRLQVGDTSPLKHVVKITSLINAPVLRAEGNALISNKLVGDKVPASAVQREAIRSTAQAQKSFPLLYFSKDYKYGGILIETNFGAIPVDADGATAKPLEIGAEGVDLSAPSAAVSSNATSRPKFKPTDLAEYVELMDEIKAVIYKPQYAQQFDYYPVGNIASAEYSLDMVKEMGLLNVIALLVITLLLWFLFRSLSAVVWSITIVILSVIWMVGITAWLGMPITAFVMVAVMLTLAVGVADVVHVLSAYMTSRNEGHAHAAAMRHGFRHVVVACLLTSITNIAAVMALSITPVVPIDVFALMCTLGVALPFIFSVYLLPLMLDVWAPRPQQKQGRGWFARLIPNASHFIVRPLQRVLPIVERRPMVFIAIFLAIFGVSLYGATKTQVDTDPTKSFPDESLIKRAVHVVDRYMLGSQSMEIYFDLGKENAFHDPMVLNAMDHLEQTIEKKYGHLVVRASSMVETVKNSYRTLNGGRADMYVIPKTKEAVSQTLFLFNQSNPEDRRKLVSDNYDKARVNVRMYNAGSFEYAKTWDAIRADIDVSLAEVRKSYPEARVSITGVLALLMEGADYLTHSELASFGFALVLICAILLLLFGSFKAGFITLVPNLIPALLAYGVLGLFKIPLDITTMMIAPIIIGIAVDDTVHFLTRYQSEVEMDGDIRRALRTTIEEAGHSVLFNTLILGLGFGMLAFSSDGSVMLLGVLGAVAMVMGLLSDLFLLPALILVFKLDFRKSQDTSHPISATEPPLPRTD